MRLDGFIAHATGLTRRGAQRYIKEGRITVGGEVARNAATRVEDMSIQLDGNPLSLPAPVYIMLNKPAGYLSANTDGQHPTVLDLLPSTLHPTEPLQIVGRLDLDTTGLLLLTTDGAWNHRITAPTSRCTKVYRAQLADPLTAGAIAMLESGIVLRSETKPTLPCQIRQTGDREVCITIQEGRYHQIKRMFAAAGNHVLQLHREQIGGLSLDPQLKTGEYRHLSEAEVQRACP